MRTLSTSERAGGLGPLAESNGSSTPGIAESEVDAVVDWILKKVGEAFPGDESIQEILPTWVRSWVKDGSSVVEIQDATLKALAKVTRASRLVGFVKSCLDSAKLASRPESELPAPISKFEAKRRALLDSFREAIPAGSSKAKALEDEFDAWAASRRKEAPDAGA